MLVSPAKHGFHHTVLIVAVLVVLASIPRLFLLDELGFYGDEETTAMPAKSMAVQGVPEMPSGMPYYRALPHTWLNSMAAQLFGVDNEFSYRISGALLGIFSVPLLFLLARPFVGYTVALVAALLLAVSDWHILTSREARMYAPFLFFYIASSFTLLRWMTEGGRLRLIIAGLMFACAVAFHTLGVFSLIFLAIPLVIAGWSRIAPKIAILAGGGFLAGFYLYNKFVMNPFEEWSHELSSKYQDNSTQVNESSGLVMQLGELPFSLLLLFGIGCIVGGWLAKLTVRKEFGQDLWLRTSALISLAILSAGLLGAGFLHGAVLCLILFFLIHPLPVTKTFHLGLKPFVVMLLLSLIALSLAAWENGFSEGVKQLVMFPFPYLWYFFELFPVVLMMFFSVSAYLLFDKSLENRFVVACVLAVFLSLIGLGVASEWGGLRYLIIAYPFLLITVAACIVALCDRLTSYLNWPQPRLRMLACSVVLVGILGGHGIPQAISSATPGYGENLTSSSAGFTIYPDHQAPGHYVRSQLENGDLVVAEDMLQQWWYVGKVDYWLRDPESHAGFLFRDSKGEFRDIYVSSLIASQDKLEHLSQVRDQRIWVITSAETQHDRATFLSDEQQSWLSRIESETAPSFIGRDRITTVFCLNCN